MSAQFDREGFTARPAPNARIDTILSLIDSVLPDPYGEGELDKDECNCDSDTAWRLQLPCPIH